MRVEPPQSRIRTADAPPPAGGGRSGDNAHARKKISTEAPELISSSSGDGIIVSSIIHLMRLSIVPDRSRSRAPAAFGDGFANSPPTSLRYRLDIARHCSNIAPTSLRPSVGIAPPSTHHHPAIASASLRPGARRDVTTGPDVAHVLGACPGTYSGIGRRAGSARLAAPAWTSRNHSVRAGFRRVLHHRRRAPSAAATSRQASRSRSRSVAWSEAAVAPPIRNASATATADQARTNVPTAAPVPEPTTQRPDAIATGIRPRHRGRRTSAQHNPAGFLPASTPHRRVGPAQRHGLRPVDAARLPALKSGNRSKAFPGDPDAASQGAAPSRPPAGRSNSLPVRAAPACPPACLPACPQPCT
jgi:hypothetical protein